MNSDLFAYLAQERALSAVSVNEALAVAMDKQPNVKASEEVKPTADDTKSEDKTSTPSPELFIEKKEENKEDSPKADESKKVETKDEDSSAKKYLSRINKKAKETPKKELGFDDVADDVNLNDDKSVQEAFDLYRKENIPPCDIEDILDEEKFFLSKNDGNNGNETVVRLDFIVPAIEDDEEVEKVRQYLEDFLDRIGVEEPYNEVTCELTDDGRGGSDCEISICHKVDRSEA